MKKVNVLGYAAVLLTACSFSYHLTAAEQLPCEKKCYVFTGVGAINPATEDIVCGQFDPHEAHEGIWITLGYAVGGPAIKDGLNTYDYQQCDTNECQLYCIPCGANDLQVSDPEMTGCRDVLTDQQRHKCDPVVV